MTSDIPPRLSSAARRLRTLPSAVRACASLAALGLALTAAPARLAADDATSPPNIVLIISDDQSWTDYGFMGHEHIETPRLDQLAAESLTYTHGYVPSSLCRPSLITIATGLFPWQHGVTSNDPALPESRGNFRQAWDDPEFRAAWFESRRMIQLLPSVPRRLHEELDYASHQSGKWWEGHHVHGGFTHGMTHGDTPRGGRHGDVGLTIGRQGMEPVAEFLDEVEDRPFLIWYAPFLPHTPHNPPQRLLDKYLQRTDSEPVARYWAMCEWFDETCGELLDLLTERGLDDNTLVIFVCDNGWLQNPDQVNRSLDTSKRWPHDLGVRTPIMLRWPGAIEPEVVTVPVSSVDIAPTILEVCGLEPGAELPGINLLDRDAVQARSAIYGDVHDHNFNPRPFDPAATVVYRWVIENGWKLIVPEKDNIQPGDEFAGSLEEGIELYHLAEDPFEQHNLAEQEPDRAQRLGDKLDRWWRPQRRAQE